GCSTARVSAFPLSCNLADTVLHNNGSFFRRELPPITKISVRFELLRFPNPERDHLSNLLFNGHAPEKISDASIYWEIGIAIVGFLRSTMVERTAASDE